MPDAFAARPSSHSVQRLESSVGRDADRLRSSIVDALEVAARHEADGRVDLAVEVLEQQRAVLADVHARLEQHVAAAAVEHEAESELRAAADRVADVAACTADAGDDAPAEPVRAEERAGQHDARVAPALPPAPKLLGRVLVSAVTAVAGLALLLLPEPQVGTIGIAATDAREPGTSTDSVPDDEADVTVLASDEHRADAATASGAGATTATDDQLHPAATRAEHGGVPRLDARELQRAGAADRTDDDEDDASDEEVDLAPPVELPTIVNLPDSVLQTSDEATEDE